jgi:hypothetical protein
MLHDLDKTFEKMLYEYGNLNKKEIDVSFELPNRDWSARLSRPTINCWCFNIRENLKLRDPQLNYEQLNGTTGRRYQFPRRMDFTYLITTWTRKAEDEHQLIWRALSAMKRFTTIEQAMCEGDLRYAARPIPLLVATEGDNPINLADLWSVLDNDMRLGFTIRATLELELDMAFEAPLVLEGTIRIGQSEDPRTRELQAVDFEVKHTEATLSDNGEKEE